MEYLGHIVSHGGIKVDPDKTKSIMEWEIPNSLNNIGGFLGWTSYYCSFVNNYGKIEELVRGLLKKEEFSRT